MSPFAKGPRSSFAGEVRQDRGILIHSEEKSSTTACPAELRWSWSLPQYLRDRLSFIKGGQQ